MFNTLSGHFSPAIDGLTLAGVATAVAITIVVYYLHRCSIAKNNR